MSNFKLVCPPSAADETGIIFDAEKELREFYEIATAFRLGDIVSVTGRPGRTERGELSLFASEHFKLLAPCLYQIPDAIEHPEKRLQHRHVDLLVNSATAQTLRLRSKLVHLLRKQLINKDFVEVQTPILSTSAGGALAKPFLTEASTLSHRKLAMRIAPELWLKRLVVGGLDRVFEIGPQFRNEGIDSTHNPEFTTCEFYMAYGTLEYLMSFTETVLREMHRATRKLQETSGICSKLPPLDEELTQMLYQSFQRLEFIPTLEAQMGRKLPNLDPTRPIADVTADLLRLCRWVGVELADKRHMTPAKLLDKLAAKFIEPLCRLPTFIIHHPEIMSPLAASTIMNNQYVSLRCELYINGQELVNAYEEENSPYQQRKKFRYQLEADRGFLEQSDESREEVERSVDESYCEALEWGMPPTAGWGMGLDRVVMLFSGQERISDVLAFGGLKGAVNQGLKKVEIKKHAPGDGGEVVERWAASIAETERRQKEKEQEFMELDEYRMLQS